MQEPFKFCSTCGRQNNLSATFCQSCGARYGEAPPPIAPTQSKPQTLKFLLFLVAAVFACSIFGGIFKALSSKTIAPIETARPVPSRTPAPSPTPDLPSSELLSRAKVLLARPYDKYGYDSAMDLLERVPSTAKEFKESIGLRHKIIMTRDREREVERARNRKDYARRAEEGLLSDGVDATVTVSGPESRTVKITYALMSRPLIYKLIKEKNFLRTMEAQGFRRVIFADGYNWTWWYTYDEKLGQWK